MSQRHSRPLLILSTSQRRIHTKSTNRLLAISRARQSAGRRVFKATLDRLPHIADIIRFVAVVIVNGDEDDVNVELAGLLSVGFVESEIKYCTVMRACTGTVMSTCAAIKPPCFVVAYLRAGYRP